MSDTAKATAAPASFDFRGITYTLTPPDYLALGRYSLWLEGRAWATVARASKFLPSAEATRLTSVTRQDIDAGKYEPGSRVFMESTGSVKGQKKLLALMLEPNGEAPGELVEAIFGDDEARPLALRLVAELCSDPKVIRAMMTSTPATSC